MIHGSGMKIPVIPEKPSIIGSYERGLSASKTIFKKSAGVSHAEQPFSRYFLGIKCDFRFFDRLTARSLV